MVLHAAVESCDHIVAKLEARRNEDVREAVEDKRSRPKEKSTSEERTIEAYHSSLKAHALGPYTL